MTPGDGVAERIVGRRVGGDGRSAGSSTRMQDASAMSAPPISAADATWRSARAFTIDLMAEKSGIGRSRPNHASPAAVGVANARRRIRG